MRKLFFAILLAGLAIMLASWSFADNQGSFTTAKSGAPALKTGSSPAADPSMDKSKQEAIRAEQAAEENARLESEREKQSQLQPEPLKIEESTSSATEIPAQVEPAKWQPVYGSKGELLNAEPSIQIAPYEKGYEPSMTLVNLFSENFETAWDTTGVDHPINWINNDNGNAGTRFWSVDDWHKYYYSTWTSNCARINYYPNAETTYDEWLITPAITLTGGSTACSLTWRNYYYHRTTNDSAFILTSSDNGVTWPDTLRWGATQASGYKKLDLTARIGQTVKVAFVFKAYTNPYTAAYYWYIDDVKFFADNTELLNENFETWGPGGDVPPTGWTIVDNGNVKTSAGYNLNDWQRYNNTSWTGYCARVYYVSSSPYDPEWQNEELITPSISISSGVACSLSLVQYYYHSTTTPFENYDHGYILLSSNGGSTWPETLVNHTATIGNSSTKQTFKYSLNSHAGQSIMLKFKFVNSPVGYSYWMFDDVSVDETVLLAHDVATVSLVSPTTLIQGYTLPVTTRVSNAGTNTETFQDSVKIGLTVKDTLLVERFSNPQSWTGANPPVNALGTWAILDSGKAGWSNYDWNAYYYSTWTDTIARVSYVSNDTAKSWLISPSINTTGRSAVHLSFKTYYYDAGSTSSDTAWIYGTDDNWATTRLIAMWNETHGSSSAPEYPDFDISSWAANKANVKIAFKYVGIGSSPWYWYIDNVLVYNLSTPSLVYNQGQTVTGLASLAQTNVNFANFTPAAAGDYFIKTFTALGTDLNKLNDTLTVNKTSYAHTGAGGPDAGYYSWADNINGGGPAFAWKDISSIGTPVTWTSTSGDDRYTLPIPLGFGFFFYGNTFTKLCVGENGFCSFDSLTSGYLSNYNIPYSSAPNNLLALVWDDLKQSTGNVYYYTNNVDTFIVSYVGVKWYGADSVNSFTAQIILSAPDNKIKFQYQSVGPSIPTGHTIGIENGAGTIGLQYYYNGTPAGNLAMPGLAITYSYNPPAHDMAATTLLAPTGTILRNVSFTPRTIFSNLGGATETAVPVYFNIYDSTGASVYSNSQTIASIAAAAVCTVSYTATSLSVNGNYRCTTYVALPGDSYPSNDKKDGTFVVDSHRGTGGPDAYYYKWIDNYDNLPPLILEDPPTYNWIEINPALGGSGTALWPPETTYFDDRALRFPIGFTFNFYGVDYTDAFATTNGLLAFDSTTSYSNVAIPTAAAPNNFIAPFWDDLYLRTAAGANVFYYQGGTYTVVEWYKEAQTSSDTTNYLTFEVILYNNGKILIQYQHVKRGATDYAGELATVGIESPNLTDDAVYGLQYLLNGSPALNLLRDSLAIMFYRDLPAHDIATSTFLAPSPVGVINSPVTPRVVFTNNGMNDESSVPVRLIASPGAYNNTQTAVIDSGARDTVSFAAYTPTAAGTCTLTAIAELGTDVARNNDTLKFYYTVYDTVIDFEANNGGLIASGSWGSFLGDWEYGTPSVVGPALPHSGSYCWGTQIDGYRTPGSTYGGIRSWLDMQINVGTGHNATFGFYEWYGTTSYDTMHVFVDTGAGWMSVYFRNGYLTSTAWTQYNINLSAYTGIIKLRFDYYSNSSTASYAGWYLDDFTFTNCTPYYPAHDMTTQLILAPAGAGAKNVAVTPRVVFKNNSTSTETSVPVRVIITPGVYNNAQTIASIGSMGTDTVSFANFTPTTSGTYTVTAIVSLGTDVDNSNDTLVGTYQVFDQIVDFEVSNGGFQTGGGTDWQYGTPAYASGPATAHSPVNCWGTNLTGTYTASTVSDLLFDIQVGDTVTGGQAIWGFYQWYYYESSFDGGEVRISTDNGATWTLLHPITGYTGVQNSSNPLPDQDSIFTGSTYNFWHTTGFDLSAYSNQIVSIKMSSGADGSVNYAGWYIDDFAFLNCGLYLPAHDIEVTSINRPYNQLQGGQTYSITATIRNKGANTETFTVKATDNHGFTNTQTVTALPSLSQTTVTFPGWSVTTCNNYDLRVIAQLGTDVNNTNDTLLKVYDAVNPAAYSFVGYNTNGIANASYMYSPSNIFAAQFDVTSPATGALVKAVEFKFLTIGDPFWPWPDAIHDRIRGYIFVDSDNNGIPDATPLLVDTLNSADSGWTIWAIDCAEALRACNTTKFWAGVSSVDSAHNEGLAIDSTLNNRNMYWKRVSGAWVIDSAATGDKLIRAAYDTSSTGTVTIALGSLSVNGSATIPATDTVSNTIDNIGSLCDMFYSATVIQDTPFRPRHETGDIQHNSINQAPLGYATTSDAKGTRTEPYYPPQLLRSGGPDAYGYRYKDNAEVGGPTFGWIDITSTGTAIALGDDDNEKVPMGFSFPFYGNTYDSVYIISNGYLGFGATSSDFSNDPIPNSSTPNNLIAIWWDDLDPTDLPNIYYYYDSANQRFIVSYIGVPNYWSATDTTGSLTFQAILYPNGNIKTQYLSMIPGLDSLNEATIGIENSTGTVGLEVVYNQAYMTDSLAILFTAPVFWLSTDLTTGTLDPAAPAMPFNIFMNSADLAAGTYLGRIIVNSNDLVNPSVTINVSFTVSGGGGDCEYIIGDISGDGQRLGGDVTYGVRYFKGVGTPPRDSCFMDSTGMYMYVAGDCNGNCEFRGSDITRLVAYFKGVAHLSCCHWFPTTLPPIILNTPNPLPIQQTNPGTAVIPRNDDQTIIGSQETTR